MPCRRAGFSYVICRMRFLGLPSKPDSYVRMPRMIASAIVFTSSAKEGRLGAKVANEAKVGFPCLPGPRQFSRYWSRIAFDGRLRAGRDLTRRLLYARVGYR